MVAALEKKAQIGAVLRNWSVVYLGNFLGALFLATLMTAADILPDDHGFLALAEKKVEKPFGTLFVRGMLCNWLVCMAVYISYFTYDIVSKAVCIFLPISGFVSIGFEHCIANCYIIPYGMLNGASVTVTDFLVGNLLPVTLGNMLGGIIFVAVPYFSAYSTDSPLRERSASGDGRERARSH
jgi:formate/nitrite transporter